MMNKPYAHRRLEPEPDSAAEKLLKRIGSTRDGVLMSISALYVLGYGVWSYYAWSHGLGMRPAVDAQYFVAGIVPALVLAAVFAGGRWDRRVFLCLNSHLFPQRAARSSAARKRFSITFRFLFTVWVLAWCDLVRVCFLHRSIGPWWVSALLVLLSFYCALLGTPLVVRWFVPAIAEEKPESDLWLASLYSVFFGFLTLSLYVQVFYPLIPQAWGGVGPRPATLDLVRSQVSEETLSALLPTSRSPTTNQPTTRTIVRSGPVDILFQGSSTILVRPRLVLSRTATFSSDIYELKTAAVQGIVWSQDLSGAR